MTLDACLPDHLRGPGTTITRIAAGLSGAGVYRVEAAGQVYVLKVASEREPIEAWRQSLEIQRGAGEAGVAPRVIHHDEARRAVVSEYVADRGFAARLFDPQTRGAAIRQLGETIRRVHALPLPASAAWRDPRDMMIEVLRAQPDWAEAHYALGSVLRQIGEQQQLADEHDVEYLRLSPQGTYAEAARDRLRRNPQ